MAPWYYSDGPVSSQALRGRKAEVRSLIEGWLVVHYNARLPEVLWTISYIIPHTLLYKI